MYDFDGSPLKDFFNAPEFWENTYDSGNADCCKRCAEANRVGQKACAAITDRAQRLACYVEAARRVATCVDGCSGAFPPSNLPGMPNPGPRP